MNRFQIMSYAYKKASEEGQIDKVQAEKKCRIYDFLATCDDADICALVDSSAFNEISKSYLRLAVKELIAENVIDDEQARAVRNRFALLLDEMQADEVLA